MNDITNNEMRLVLNLFKNPSTDYNTTQIAKTLSLTPMGTLKIAKKLEKENLLTSKKLGKATYYRLDSKNPYTKQHIAFLAKREAEYVVPAGMVILPSITSTTMPSFWLLVSGVINNFIFPSAISLVMLG